MSPRGDRGGEPVPPMIAAMMAEIGRKVAAPAEAPADEPVPVPGVATTDGRVVEGPPPVAIPGVATALPATALDDELRALVAPMVKAWLDAHLPEIVEAATRAEIARLTGLND